MALSLSLVYIPIPRLPDVPKSAIFAVIFILIINLHFLVYDDV